MFQSRKKRINITSTFFKISILQMCAKLIKVKIYRKHRKIFKNKNKIYWRYTAQSMIEKNYLKKEDKISKSKLTKMEMRQT